MSGPPRLPLHVGDYLKDTPPISRVNWEHHGIYLLAMFMAWNTPRCRLPDDPIWLAERFGCTAEEYEEYVKPILRRYFKARGKWLTQKRLTATQKFVAETSKKQSMRARGGWPDDDRARINTRKRSERLRAAREKGKHTTQEWEAIRTIFGRCVRCGSTEYNLEKDHIIPIYRGGSDGIENIQPCCPYCNVRKGPETCDHRSTVVPNWIERLTVMLGYKPLSLQDFDACRTPAERLPGKHPTPAYQSQIPNKKEDSKNGSAPSAPAREATSPNPEPSASTDYTNIPGFLQRPPPGNADGEQEPDLEPNAGKAAATQRLIKKTAKRMRAPTGPTDYAKADNRKRRWEQKVEDYLTATRKAGACHIIVAYHSKDPEAKAQAKAIYEKADEEMKARMNQETEPKTKSPAKQAAAS